ncbi:MAG: hypothetical protein HYX90_10205, partial [Chloroflexi bacterium]|nr:hypothetical protein [Chloroflexota bacterium]
MLFKLVLAVALFSGALLFIAHQGAPASEATRRGRYWPLLAAAGLITLMFWAHLASLMLVIAIGAAVLVYLLRGARRRVFGN